MKTPFQFFILILALMMSSCVGDLDFNQANDFELTPEFAVSLVRFTVDQNDFLVGGNEVVLPPQTTIFSVLDNTTAQENLTQVVFKFEAINTFNRDFEIDFVLLDNTDRETYRSATLMIDAEQDDFYYEELVNIAATPLFLQSTKIRVEIRLMPSSNGSVLNANNQSILIFKSAGDFYFRFS